MEQTNKQFLKTLRIVHGALIIGLINFLVISVIFNNLDGEPILVDKTLSTNILLAFNVLALSAIVVGTTISRKRISNLNELSLQEKMEKYRSITVLRSAFFEGAGFLFTVGYFILASQAFLLEALSVLLIMIFLFPTKDRVFKELGESLE